MSDLAIKNEPENHQGYLLRANSLQKLKRNEEAEEPYLRALELDEESMDLILIIAKYYVSLPGGREKAEPWLWKGLEKYPTRAMRTSLARFLSADPKRFDEAEAMFKEALATEPRPDDYAKGFINIAQFYLSNGRNELGVKALEDGTKENPDSTELHFILANYHRINGNLEEAERLIRHASTIDPTDPTAFLVLSSFLGGKEDIEGALLAADDALAADPENTDAKLRRAEILVDIGFREASAAAESVDAEPINELTKKSENINEGLKLADEILTASPFHPQAEFVRGKAYLARGDVAKGIEGFRAAAEGRPDWPQAHFALGSALASINEPRLARVEIARALELDPRMHQARRILASIHQALGEHEYAIEQGSRFLQSQPENNEARIMVAQSLIRLGKRDQALRELNKVPLDQQDMGVLFALGRLNASLGNSDASRSYLLKVLEQSPHNEKVLRSLFHVDSDTEYYVNTRQRILDAAAALPDNGDLIQLEAMVKFIDRDLEGAEAGFKR
ncbi:MAG: tetratricopeptide repeat protein, partial [bacterium]